MFNDRYGLTDAVLDGRKTMTRRIVPEGLLVKYSDYDYCVRAVAPSGVPSTRVYEKEFFIRHSRYKIGEEVAIAQSYKDLLGFDGSEYWQRHSSGWTNKMFVKAELMLHRIRITDIRVERLQDISDEDCLKEGVMAESIFNDNDYCTFLGSKRAFKSPREAFAALIDKVSGKGTWASNPFVWVYSFELIK